MTNHQLQYDLSKSLRVSDFNSTEVETCQWKTRNSWFGAQFTLDMILFSPQKLSLSAQKGQK